MKSGFFTMDGGAYSLGYYINLPANYDSSKKYPMIVFLHGSGERGNGKDELEKVKINGLCKYASQGKEYDAILLSPQCPEKVMWDIVITELKGLIDKVAREYNADLDRISLTGLSMGGFGCWDMGMAYPDFFSAIAPVCGGGTPAGADLLKNVPIWALHGDLDGAVPIVRSYEMVDAVNQKGGKAKMTIFHGVGHGSWDCAYLETTLVDWLISQRRAEPEKEKKEECGRSDKAEIIMKASTKAVYDSLFEENPALEPIRKDLLCIYEAVKSSFMIGSKLLVCGDECADSIAENLTGGFKFKRALRKHLAEKLSKGGEQGQTLACSLEGALPAYSLNDRASFSEKGSVADYAQRLLALGSWEDALIMVSGAGDCDRCICAAELAKTLEVKTIAITGDIDSSLSKLCDFCVRVPGKDEKEIARNISLLCDTFCAMQEDSFFEKCN